MAQDIHTGSTDGSSRSTPAPMGKRVGAAIIDLILVVIVGGVVGAIFGTDTDAGAFEVDPIPTAIAGLIGLAYYVVLEAQQGKTLGKMALGLRTVTEDGQPLTWGTSLGRNLLRIVDGLFLYLVGFIVAMTNPKRQRVGDMVAKTIVIQD